MCVFYKLVSLFVKSEKKKHIGGTVTCIYASSCRVKVLLLFYHCFNIRNNLATDY